MLSKKKEAQFYEKFINFVRKYFTYWLIYDRHISAHIINKYGLALADQIML